VSSHMEMGPSRNNNTGKIDGKGNNWLEGGGRGTTQAVIGRKGPVKLTEREKKGGVCRVCVPTFIAWRKRETGLEVEGGVQVALCGERADGERKLGLHGRRTGRGRLSHQWEVQTLSG